MESVQNFLKKLWERKWLRTLHFDYAKEKRHHSEDAFFNLKKKCLQRCDRKGLGEVPLENVPS